MRSVALKRRKIGLGAERIIMHQSWLSFFFPLNSIAVGHDIQMERTHRTVFINSSKILVLLYAKSKWKTRWTQRNLKINVWWPSRISINSKQLDSYNILIYDWKCSVWFPFQTIMLHAIFLVNILTWKDCTLQKGKTWAKK